jgi:hypothetical protein
MINIYKQFRIVKINLIKRNNFLAMSYFINKKKRQEQIKSSVKIYHYLVG